MLNSGFPFSNDALVPVETDLTKCVTKDLSELAAISSVITLDVLNQRYVDYVFFRRFADNRSSQVAAYVIDNRDLKVSEEELARFHWQVWLQGSAPFVHVIWDDSRVDILSCARGPDFKNGSDSFRYNPILSDSIKITDQLYRLADGRFWEEGGFREWFQYSKAAHHSLTQAVVEIDRKLKGKNFPVRRRLLLLTVLIKYLEDRNVFPEGYFNSFDPIATSFLDMMRSGNSIAILDFLQSLEEKFNGDIFQLPEADKSQITADILRELAYFIEGKSAKGQLNLWKLYSFEHLPVEMISHLYQRFVEGGTGSVYTPPFLTSLLLDQVMPYATITGEERVLDPSCGSGIFLVGAFKRLINVWRSQHNWQKPTVGVLKEKLYKGIFGVDQDSSAIHLASFSLNLAICDSLQPDIIWDNLRFEPLINRNLHNLDYFEFLTNVRQSGEFDAYDIIVGNPPFDSKLTESAIKVNKDEQTKSNRGNLPDNQIAYLFLEQSIRLLSKGGTLCMIQPHGLLYNSNAEKFRSHIFSTHSILHILDFISIRQLYEADSKTVAIIAKSIAPNASHQIKHWTFRRTVSVQERICFELDYYDRHKVNQSLATSFPLIWRANLLGGGRLVELSQRLQKIRNLATHIREKAWEYGEGFIVAEHGKRSVAPHLTGLPLLPTDAFQETGIRMDEISTVTDTEFRSAYTMLRFTPPLILIKKNSALPIYYWTGGPIAYKHQVVGIHSPISESKELKALYRVLEKHRHLYKLSCTLNGSQSLMSKSTAILKSDIDAFPMPEDMEELKLAYWEQALCDDVINYMDEYILVGQNSQLLTKTANEEDLECYGLLFERMLGTVYGNLRRAKAQRWDGFISQTFFFGENDNGSCLLGNDIAQLRSIIFDDQCNKILRNIRVVRYYDDNMLTIIKPDRLRFWIRSTAIRDADDTLKELYQGGF